MLAQHHLERRWLGVVLQQHVSAVEEGGEFDPAGIDRKVAWARGLVFSPDAVEAAASRGYRRYLTVGLYHWFDTVYK